MNNDLKNLCECFWASQLQIRRLLSRLQESQSLCSDTECLSVSRFPELPEPAPRIEFLMVFMILGVMALLFAFRPQSLRPVQSSTKINEIRDSDNNPPGPPTSSN